jgi:uncharacterized protein with HEPN domain
MARRSQRLRLLDIAREIAAVEAAVAGRSSTDLAEDWLVRSAMERGVEIISEASRHLDPDLLAAHPEVPWRRVADIGNWLRHAYERVDPALILAIVTDHFPALSAAVAVMLAQVPED